MSIEDDFDSEYYGNDEDDAAGDRTLNNPFDSEREKDLREWHDRFAEIICRFDVFETGIDEDDPTVQAFRQWQATHVREVVALPCPRFGGTENCEIFIQPKPGCTFKTNDPKFARFALYSGRIWRKLKYKEAAHRGWTLDEISDDDDERYLLDGIIPAAELSVIYGAPKHGKSAWAQKLSVCVVSDELDFDGVRVEHGRVLYVSLDTGARREKVRHRIKQICDRLGVLEVMDNKRLVVVDDVVFLDDPDSVDHLLQRVPGKFALVIVDPLYKALTSGDPSIAGAMVKATEGMKTIIEATGGAMIVVHHATKANGEMYGSVFLKAALDSQLFVERVRDTVTVTVEVVKNGEPPDTPSLYRLEKEFLLPVANDPPERRDDEPARVTRADMLALMPVEWMPTHKARALVEHLLTARTPAGREKEWERVRTAWERSGLIVQKSRKLRRVAP